MHFVDHVDQRSDRHVGDNLVCESEAFLVADLPTPMAGQYVGMRLVEYEGVGSLRAHSCKKIDVPDEPASARDHRPIVLDLARYQYMATLSRRALERRDPTLVFADAHLDDQEAKLACAVEQPAAELSMLQNSFEIALAGRIEIGARSIDRDRKRRNAIGAKPT